MPKRASGEGSIKKRTYQRANGTRYTRWYARVTLAWDGQQQETHDGPMRDTQTEAREDLKRLTDLRDKGLVSTKPKQRLEDFLNNWLEQVVINKKFGTYRTHRQVIDTYINPELGHMRLDKIKREHIQRALNNVHQDLVSRGRDGRAMVRKCRAALHSAFEYLIDEEPTFYSIRNPAKKVDIPSETTKEIEPWSQEEAATFFEVLKTSRYYPLVYTALTSGMREGELLALRWRDLSKLELQLGGKTRRLLEIRVRHTLKMVTKKDSAIARRSMQHLYGRFFLDTPKTKKSKSSVLVAEDTLEVLWQVQKPWIRRQRNKLGARWHELDLVFPASNGVPLDGDNMREDYKAILERAGVRYLTFHDLRDTHASRLQTIGKELAVVSERLRHSRKSTTADKYTHSLSSSRLAGAVTLDELFQFGKEKDS